MNGRMYLITEEPYHDNSTPVAVVDSPARAAELATALDDTHYESIAAIRAIDGDGETVTDLYGSVCDAAYDTLEDFIKGEA